MSGSRKSLKKATVFNPRASNDWSKDESKFGLKMLEKMGWKQGQGIGLNNQGITENVKVRLKLDSKGLGYQIKEDQWLEVRSEFSELLSQLSQGVEDEDEALEKGKKSLRAVSESSKTRVHYHKFTHGKDIARYKKEDLIGILGKKEKDESIVPENKEFIQSGNMDEYFKSKKRKLEPANSNPLPADNSQVDDITAHDSTDSMKPVKKKKVENDDLNFPSTNDACEVFNLNSESSPKSVKKKKKKIENFDENLPSTENSLVCDILDHSSTNSKSAKKKKSENGDQNLPSADNSQAHDTLNHDLVDPVKPAKKKRELEDNDQDTPSADISQDCDILELNSEDSKSEKKKKRKKNIGIGDLNLPSAENSQACEIIDHSSDVSVKSAKKTKKMKNCDQDLSSADSSQPCNIIDQNSAGSLKFSLKKSNVQNVDHNLMSENFCQACDILDPKRTSKKKKLENSDINPSTNNSQACDISDQNSADSLKPTKKKKKKLDKMDQNLPSAHDSQDCNILNLTSKDCLKSEGNRTTNSGQNLSNVSDLQARDIPDQTTKKKKKKALENSDQNQPSVKNSRTIKIIDQNSADFMKSVIDYNSCNNVEDIISKFEKSREELLNKYREKYKKKHSESSSEIKVFGDEFDGRKLDCKKPTNDGESVMKMYNRKNKSKGERAVARAVLMRSIEEGVVTHNFEGSNLTNISGYGSEIC